MKNYICLNHGECQWADETPPREFPLVDSELYCPNCESTNIREPVPEQNKFKRLLPFIAGAIIILCLVWLFRPEKTKVIKPQPPKEGVESDTANGKGNDSVEPIPDAPTKIGKEDSVSPPVKPPKKTVVWTLLENSGFCDPALDGTYFYSERNNLGQTRERKVMNKSGCYPTNQ